jgi:hypothetical protein
MSPGFFYWPLNRNLEADADAEGGQMVGCAAGANRPIAGRCMGGIHGRTESVICSADEQITVLAEHVGVVAKGDAKAGLGLCGKAPSG